MKKIAAIIVCSLFIVGCAAVTPTPPTASQETAGRLVDQGVQAMRDGRLDDADASFQAAYEIANFPAAIDGLGCVALRRKQYDRAIELFKSAYEIDNEYTRALGNLALAYELNGDRELAEATYKQAIYEDPEDFRARGNYGGMLIDFGTAADIERAKKELMKAYAIVPHPVIEQNLKEVK